MGVSPEFIKISGGTPEVIKISGGTSEVIKISGGTPELRCCPFFTEFPVNVRFPCPSCDYPNHLALACPQEWECPVCNHRQHVDRPEPTLPACVLCGTGDLYKKKNFPHWLGMSLLVGACLVSVFTYGLYEKWLTWAILIGTAVFDGLLYLLVGDVTVCYRCNAHYRGRLINPVHGPYELTVGERYRQERLRKEQMKAGS